MKTMIAIIYCILYSAIGMADSINCDSANVAISGEVQTHYLRMGHSTFTGPISITIKQGTLGSIYTALVYSGDIQDTSISFSDAVDRQGRAISMESSGLQSTVHIGDQIIQFQPQCSVTPSPTEPSGNCESDPWSGRYCSNSNGACICHFRNPGH